MCMALDSRSIPFSPTFPHFRAGVYTQPKTSQQVFRRVFKNIVPYVDLLGPHNPVRRL
jgi:hypothetical protein